LYDLNASGNEDLGMSISKTRCGLSFFVQSVICDRGQMVPDSESNTVMEKEDSAVSVRGTGSGFSDVEQAFEGIGLSNSLAAFLQKQSSLNQN
jgi:hypothetical protein